MRVSLTGREPVAEDPRVDEEHGLTVAAVGIANVALSIEKLFIRPTLSRIFAPRAAVPAFPSR